MFTLFNKITKPFLIILCGTTVFAIAKWPANPIEDNNKTSYILVAKNLSKLEDAITQTQLIPSHKLSIINAFVVSLNADELADLKSKVEFTATVNHKVELSGWRKGQRRWQPEAIVADYIDATNAHRNYNFGDGVTIGFLDTGLDQLPGLSTDLYGNDKAWGTYDAINNSVSNYDDEASGHGTHVASIAANSDYDVYGRIYGVAPNAALVGIKAFDADGQATYADVIRGIDWAVQVKDQINLRVLNMSFSGPVRSYYWDDPLNQAVMKAWQSGIVVVASAGNTGPDPMTIGVPGNVPYIITVGAMTDTYTINDELDDKLATFSSAGPTYEGFVKPEILAPGGHLSGLMSYDSQIVLEHPDFHDGGRYFEMSGTSQAAGVISGVVALLLTQDPTLTPDEVKCRIIASAHAARTTEGILAYSVFQQGAGVVNVADALNNTETNCSNNGLDIAKDITGEQHFSGPANVSDDGNFYIEGLGEEYIWRTNDVKSDVLVWKQGLGIDLLVWKSGLETDLGIDLLVWKSGLETGFGIDLLVWKSSIEVNTTETIKVNHWVEQQ